MVSHWHWTFSGLFPVGQTNAPSKSLNSTAVNGEVMTPLLRLVRIALPSTFELLPGISESVALYLPL
ncbi:hypothetical protein CEXT_732901 [Caerostris extrusa]|uniref:Uncharacterized protein n=1 Tax=Caerostris extrusa TaxID=172846 RepID=A0AAV4QXH2_CAEEX|nr:hypothetical protein CEXT_732901 [Caerostris extrusa]